MTAFEDQLAIRALLERYCDGVNQRDADIWGSTWAEDAVWELPHLDMEGITGGDNIIAAWLQAMELFSFCKHDGPRATYALQGTGPPCATIPAKLP